MAPGPRLAEVSGAEVLAADGEDVAARRFYERHGYTTDRAVDQDEPAVIYYRELA